MASSIGSEWRALPGLRALGAAEENALKRVLERRALYRGDGIAPPCEVREAERELAARYGRRHALLFNSATSALHAALHALGVGRGDEVIVPGYGWITNLSVVLQLGATPVLAPVTSGLSIDPASVERCLSSKTRAVTRVHALGLPAAKVSIGSIPLLDDACQALGTEMNGRPAGSDALMSVLSFQAYKLITSGEGGCLLTDDDALYTRAVRFHDAGLARFAHSAPGAASEPIGIGLNLRMSELTAAVLRAQLERLDGLVAQQRAAYARMVEAFQPWSSRGWARVVEPPTGGTGNGTTLVLEAESAERAARLAAAMRQHGVGVVYALEDRLHTQPGWVAYLEAQSLPHRVVERQRSDAIIARTLMLDVNAALTSASWDALRRSIDSEE
jgi:8-amino-3,8-dideoxy-alpha-D-manno-octulosonate transaminase